MVHAALSKVVTNVFFGQGVLHAIHLDNVECNGNESSLLDCTHAGVGNEDCNHHEDVGIICRPSQGIQGWGGVQL